MPGCLIGAPQQLATSGSFSWAVGAADALYPLSNLSDLDPGRVAKANATTATLRRTFGGATALVGVGLFNTNNPGATVTLQNNGGMANQARTVPTPLDGLSRNVWWDLRDVASASAAQWDLVWSGVSAPPAVGAVVYVTQWTELRIQWRYRIGQQHPVIEHRTEGERRLILGKGVRIGSWHGQTVWTEDIPAVTALRESARGPLLPWVLVPDLDMPHVMLVQFSADTQMYEYEFHTDDQETGLTPMSLAVEEVNAGMSP